MGKVIFYSVLNRSLDHWWNLDGVNLLSLILSFNCCLCECWLPCKHAVAWGFAKHAKLAPISPHSPATLCLFNLKGKKAWLVTISVCRKSHPLQKQANPQFVPWVTAASCKHSIYQSKNTRLLSLFISVHNKSLLVMLGCGWESKRRLGCCEIRRSMVSSLSPKC